MIHATGTFNDRNAPRRSLSAFTVVELLTVGTVLSLLAGLVLPALSRAQEQGRRSSCLSNLRHLQLATTLYASDHEGLFPTRRTGSRWPSLLGSYELAPRLLLCPSDKAARPALDLRPAFDDVPRSYVLNGFQDPSVTSIAAENWAAYLSGPLQGTVRESSIQNPTETILLGEKLSESEAFYADLHRQSGSFLEVLAPSRHPGRDVAISAAKGGGANHVFVDGSARYLSRGKATCPLNLWGVTDYYRTNYALCFF